MTVIETAGLIRSSDDAIEEALDARLRWPRYNSAHEGLGVLLEEVRELEAHVFRKQKDRDLAAMRKEAIQVAAVAIRFADECCDEEVPHDRR
jgi:NTP pyrophosphatase (non-canonical NTP hydrolase)